MGKENFNPAALFKLSYGLYVVSSVKNGSLNGQIANTVFQVTANPPQIAVSINKKNLTHEFIESSRVFTVSVLEKDTPLSFIGHFGFKSGRDVDKFRDVKYKIGEVGAPIVIENTLSYMEANVVNSIDCGTHTLFIAEVISADLIKDGEPMTYAYYHKVKGGKSPKTSPTYIKEENKEVKSMKKYRCKICGYIYDPEQGDPDNGVNPGTPFEELPDDWVCPLCGASKDEFEEI